MEARRWRDGGRGHEPRGAGNLQELTKARKSILPWSLQKEPALPIHFRLLMPQDVRD